LNFFAPLRAILKNKIDKYEKSSSNYTYSEKDDLTVDRDETSWYRYDDSWSGYGTNWTEDSSSESHTNLDRSEKYDRNMKLSYVVEDGVRSDKSFNETVNGHGNVKKTHTSKGSLDYEYEYVSTSTWGTFSSRTTRENSQTDDNRTDEEEYDFSASRSSRNNSLPIDNSINISANGHHRVTGENYQHSISTNWGSYYNENEETTSLNDNKPINDNNNYSTDSPGFANYKSVVGSMGGDPGTFGGGIHGDYNGCGTESPNGPSGVKISVPEITFGKPGYGNFTFVDVSEYLPKKAPATPEPAAPTEPPAPTTTPASHSSGWLDYLQATLDVVGFVPVIGSVADLINGGIHLAHGNYVEAGFSVIAIVPVYGDTVAGARKVAKAADKVGDIIKTGNKADEAVDITKRIVNNDQAVVKDVIIDAKKYPESAQHIKDSGFDNSVVTIDRKQASVRRREALKDKESSSHFDRDESPPATFKEGSQSVRNISIHDNRGAGASIGNQIRNLPDGTKVRLKITVQ
jgi:hypothetical protein